MTTMLAYDEDDFPCHRCGQMTNYRKLHYLEDDDDLICPDCDDELTGDEE